MTARVREIQETLARVPANLRSRSGAVFYSGMQAFAQPSPLYVLGLNPGGSPLRQAKETIGLDIEHWAAMPPHYSRYLDESWEGRTPGTHGMQPRMQHMFAQLDLDLRRVPASNLVFVRSTGEAELASEKQALLSQCWPVHAVVIGSLGINTILCLGTTAGRWVREKTGATKRIGTFAEQNGRGWISEAHTARDGRAVVTVTHPGRADWRNPKADPTPLLRTVLNRVTGSVLE